jgi:predicted ester cyclase
MPYYPNPQANERKVLARNKAIMRRLLVAFTRGDTSAIDEFFSPHLVSHSPHVVPFDGHPIESLKKEMLLPFKAFPDQNFREENLVAEGDMVFLGWEMTGTFSGSLFRKKGKGIPFTLHGGEVVRMKDGKVVEHWDHFTKPRLESLIEIGLLDQSLLNQFGKVGLL